MTGCLSIVATPIGCLEDISLRALRILQEADAILAEDTRHTRALCTRHEIRTPLRALHEHTEQDRIDAIVEELAAGAHFALVSDAGTPVVSDPGSYLVSRAAEAGVTVEPIPGPSAVVAALSVAGLPMRRFTFEGFVPRGPRARKEALSRIAESEAATVVFESPYRIHDTLNELEALVGPDRRVALCRELTKVYEQTLRGTIPDVRAELADPPKGEITLVIEGNTARESAQEVDVPTLVTAWEAEGLSTKEMTQRLQQEAHWPRNQAYQAILTARGHSASPKPK
ncbi:MAG: 16S rRNA (cytidine(1402)-2'-O)-methyltransferase [Myxococcota bacterium]